MHFKKLTSVLNLILILSLFVIIPFMIFGKDMYQFVSALMENNTLGLYTYAGIVMILMACDVFLPIPSSIVSTWSGHYFGFMSGWLISTLGMTIGCILGYYIGMYGRCLIKEKLKIKCESAVANYGFWAIAIFRGIPVLAEVSVIFFGIGKYSIRQFLIVSTLANFGISAVYSYAGSISNINNNFIYAIIAAILLPLSFQIIYKLVLICDITF